MDQRKTTNGEMVYPTIELTAGQSLALSYLRTNTKWQAGELYQLIFDAGLVRTFEAATQMHAEYLAEAATATKGGNGGENPS